MRSAAVAAALAVLLVAGCSADSGDDPPSADEQASPSASASASSEAPAEEESAEAEAPPAVAGRLPAGELATGLEVKATRPKGDQLGVPSIAFTDRYVIAWTPSFTLRAVDRTTLQEAWSTQVPVEDASARCPLPAPAREAAYVSVFSGLRCERLLTFELATGAPVADETTADEWVTGYGPLGDGTTFWTGHYEVGKIGTDGVPAPYADLDELGVTDQDSGGGVRARSSSLLDGTTVVAVQVSDSFGDDIGTGRVVGVDLGGETAEVVFDVPIADLGLPGGAPKQFELLAQPGGVWRAQLGNGGYALGSLDPATGTVTGHLVEVPSFNEFGLPIIFNDAGENSAVLGSAVFTAVSADPSSGRVADVARYDLDLGTETWRATIAPTKGEPKTGVAVRVVVRGIAADGEHGYVTYSAGGGQTDLVEIDLATGAETGRWPDIEREVLNGEWYVDGDLLVGVSASLVLRKQTELVVKQPS